MKVLFAADMSFNYMDAVPKNGEAMRIMTKTAEIFRKADYSIVNLENIFGNKEDYEPIPKSGPNLIANDKYIEYIDILNPTAVGLANNHSRDFGDGAFFHTMDMLKKRGYQLCGAGENVQKAYEPAIFDDGTTKVHIIAVCENEVTTCRTKNESKAELNTTLGNAYVNLRGFARDAVVLLDDTCVYTVEQSYTVTEDFQDGEADIQTNRTNYATIKTDESGNSYLNFAAVTNTTGGEGHTYITIDPISDHAVLGSSYEISFKLRANRIELPSDKTARTWWLYLGAFTNATVTDTFANSAVEVSNATGFSGGTGAETVAKFCGTDLTLGEWYEVKMVFTVTAITDTTISLSTTYSLGDNTKTFTTKTFKADDVIGIGFKTPSKGTSTAGYISELNIDVDDITVTAKDTYITTDIETPAE